MFKDLKNLAAFVDFVRYSDFEFFFGRNLAAHLHMRFIHKCDHDPIKFFCSLDRTNKRVFSNMVTHVAKTAVNR